MKKFSIFVFLAVICEMSAAQKSDSLHIAYRHRVLEYSHEIKSAVHYTAIADEAHHAAMSDYFPSIKLDAEFNIIGPYMDDEQNHPSSDISYGTTLTLTQPIYMGGGIISRSLITREQIQLADNNRQLTHNNVCYSADKAYWTTVSKHEIVSLAVDFELSLKRLEKIVEDRIGMGVDDNDLLMTQVKLNESQYLLHKAVNSAVAARKVLHALAGLKPTDSLSIDTVVVPISEADVTVIPIDSIIMGRPEVMIAENNINITHHQSRLDNSYYIPHLHLGIEGCYTNFSPHVLPGYSFYVKLTYNITDSGKGFRTRRIGHHKEKIALENYSKVNDIVRVEIETAIYNYTQAVDKVVLTQNSLEKAEENERMSFVKFESGELSVVEILDAQVYRQKARLNYIESKLNAQIALSNYLRICNIY